MVLIKKVKKKLRGKAFIRKAEQEFRKRKFYGNGISKAENRQKILFWTTGGMVIQTNLEAVYASALKLRGHEVKMVLCDGVFKACAKRVDNPEIEIKDWGKLCPGCIKKNTSLLDRLGIDYKKLNEFLSEDELKNLRALSQKVNFDNYKKFVYKNYNIGTHIESAMTRHTKGGSFEGLEELLREYAFAVLVITETSEKFINKYKPDKIYMSHGIYADWGPACTVALANNIPVISYVCSYLNRHFFFGIIRNHKETFTGIRNESWNNFRDNILNEKQKERLYSFLNRRYLHKVTGDMKNLIKDYKGDREYFLEKYKLDRRKPVWGIMTHINWDAVSDYFPMLYDNFDEWLYDTVKTIIDVKDVQWLIKIHPSEKIDNPETGCQKFIENNFPDLPEHIKVVKYDDDINTEDFYSLLDGAVTVMGTGGLEFSLKGKPVILAGEAHYSGKGFTYDPADIENYRKLLKDASGLKPTHDKIREKAEMYAYIYFILKQIPLPPAVNEDLKIEFDKLNSIFPGEDKFTDFVCARIVDGEDFILPDEFMETTKVEQKNQIRHFA